MVEEWSTFIFFEIFCRIVFTVTKIYFISSSSSIAFGYGTLGITR